MVHYHYPSVYLERLETPILFAKAGLWEGLRSKWYP